MTHEVYNAKQDIAKVWIDIILLWIFLKYQMRNVGHWDIQYQEMKG